jgi:hypothetical protein
MLHSVSRPTASAAGAMGVPKAKTIPSQGHQKMSPDNMDFVSCRDLTERFE